MTKHLDNYLDWKQWHSAEFGVFSWRDALYYPLETGICRERKCRVIEVGFGNGSFMAWAHGVGAELWGVETNSLLLNRAADLIGSERVLSDLHDSRLDEYQGTFTHIVAFDVLEHVPQEMIPTMLSRMRELLGAHGKIILRFPNGDSPFGRIYQHGDPTHVTTIGRGKIEYFAQMAGLRLEAVRAPILPLVGVGFLRRLRRTGLLLGRWICERLIAHLYLNGRMVSLDPNYVAVLVRSEGRVE